jgi:hypothetical protein
MVYKRRCPTSLPTIDGMKTCGPIANIGTHEEFQKLAPANMQITQDQWRQLMAALVANVAVKSLQGAGV